MRVHGRFARLQPLPPAALLLAPPTAPAPCAPRARPRSLKARIDEPADGLPGAAQPGSSTSPNPPEDAADSAAPGPDERLRRGSSDGAGGRRASSDGVPRPSADGGEGGGEGRPQGSGEGGGEGSDGRPASSGHQQLSDADVREVSHIDAR